MHAPSGISHQIVLECCRVDCGAKYSLGAAVEVYAFPTTIPALNMRSAPLGWEVAGRMVLCPDHATVPEHLN